MGAVIWFATALLLFWSTAAEQVSENQCFVDKPDESTLKCWGDDIETRQSLKIPDGSSIAEFCRTSPVFMECGRGISPDYPFFNNVAGVKDSLVPKYITESYSDSWGNDRRKYYHTAMLLCYEKCVCNSQIPTTPQTLPKSAFSSCEDSGNTIPNLNKIVVYNFDKQDVRFTQRKPSGNFSEFYGPDQGLMSATVGWFRSLNLQYTPKRPFFPRDIDLAFGTPDESMELARIQYVGDPKNKPFCRDAVNGTGHRVPLDDAVGAELTIFLKTIFGATMPTPQQLCAHTFYGGRNRTNLGAVCKNSRYRRPSLSIEWQRVSPLYLPEYYSFRVLPIASLPFIAAFCGASCVCEKENQGQIDQRQSLFNKLQNGLAIPKKSIFIGDGTGEGQGGTDVVLEQPVGPSDLSLQQEIQNENQMLTQQAMGGGIRAQGEVFEIQGAPGSSHNRPCSSNTDCPSDQVCLASTRQTLRDIGAAIISIFLCCVARDAIDTNRHGSDGRPGG